MRKHARERIEIPRANCAFTQDVGAAPPSGDFARTNELSDRIEWVRHWFVREQARREECSSGLGCEQASPRQNKLSTSRGPDYQLLISGADRMRRPVDLLAIQSLRTRDCSRYPDSAFSTIDRMQYSGVFKIEDDFFAEFAMIHPHKTGPNWEFGIEPAFGPAATSVEASRTDLPRPPHHASHSHHRRPTDRPLAETAGDKPRLG